MADIERKLDQILRNQNEIKERVSNLEDTLNGISRRLAINENRLSKVEGNQENLQAHVAKLELKIKEIQQENLKQKENFKLDQLNRELYSKRFNFLIHGLPEDKMFKWETRDKTLAIFYRFVEDGLKIKPENLRLVDIHRLPQTPVFGDDDLRRDRPIIIKLGDSFSKRLFMNSFKNLKAYNKNNREENPSAPYIFVSEHLPKELQMQKKKLLPRFKEAKAQKKNTQWRIENAQCCLYIDNKKVVE